MNHHHTRRNWAGRFVTANVLLLALLTFPGTAVGAAEGQKNEVSADSLLAQSQSKAITVLVAAIRGGEPYVRANAIEAMEHVPDRALPMAELGLRDEHPAVRFAALVTLGQLSMPSYAGVAERHIRDDNPSVRAAAMFAARKCGSQISISQMSSLLMSDDPNVRANTAMLIGLMGDASAITMLTEAGGRVMPRVPHVKQMLMRIQIAEARVRLGDDAAIDAIRAGAFSSMPEIRMLSIAILGRLGDAANLEDALLSILRDSQGVLELRLATAATLVQGGRRVLVREVLDEIAIVLSAAQLAEPAFRVQAAATLGAIETARRRIRQQLVAMDPPSIRRQFTDPAATRTLVGLLDDRDTRVRVAAAAAVVTANQK